MSTVVGQQANQQRLRRRHRLRHSFFRLPTENLSDSFSAAMVEVKDIEKLFETDGYLRSHEHEIRRRWVELRFPAADGWLLLHPPPHPHHVTQGWRRLYALHADKPVRRNFIGQPNRNP